MVADSYVAVSVTENGKDDNKYERNEKARKELLGDFQNTLIKFAGVDETYSLFKEETRKRRLAWISTPLSIAVIVLMVLNAQRTTKIIQNALSWKWSEGIVLNILAQLSMGSAVALIKWTMSLFFLNFHDALKQAGRQNEICAVKGARLVKVTLCFLFFMAIWAICEIKYAVRGDHVLLANETSIEDGLNRNRIFGIDALLGFIGAVLSALALSIYGCMHGIAEEQITEFNTDIQKESENGQLAANVSSFASRHIAIVKMVRTLSKGMTFFATFPVLAGLVIHALVMFLGMVYEKEIDVLGGLCLFFWFILSLILLTVALMQPAGLQKLLNKGIEVVLADGQLWKEQSEVAQSMITRVRTSDTKIAAFGCLRVTQWSAQAVMLASAVFGGLLVCLKFYA